MSDLSHYSKEVQKVSDFNIWKKQMDLKQRKRKPKCNYFTPLFYEQKL